MNISVGVPEELWDKGSLSEYPVNQAVAESNCSIPKGFNMFNFSPVTVFWSVYVIGIFFVSVAFIVSSLTNG